MRLNLLSPLRALSLALFGLLVTPVLAQQVVYVESAQWIPTQPTGRFIGSLRARSTSVMAALEEGALLELAVREADTVRKGDVLARVDSRRLQMSLAQVGADLAKAAATQLEREANLANAVADLEALKRAAESGAVSERDLRNARTVVTVGQSLVEAAKQSIASMQANRDLLGLRIEDSIVRAPFDARVIARHAEVGQWIRPGDSLVTLVSTGALEAWIKVPERFMGRFDAQLSSVPLLMEGTGAMAEGTRPRTIPMVDERARTFTMILDVQPQGELASGLQPGMSVSAVVPLGKLTPRLVLHKDAILRRGTNSLVAKVSLENNAVLVPVRVLFSTEGGVAVEPLEPGALIPGDRIVVEGNERLYPGTPVTPQENTPKPKADEPSIPAAK